MLHTSPLMAVTLVKRRHSSALKQDVHQSGVDLNDCSHVALIGVNMGLPPPPFTGCLCSSWFHFLMPVCTSRSS